MNFDLLPQILVNSLITSSIYALVGVGMALSFGVLKILNFAHGSIMALGAFIFLWLFSDMGWGFCFGLVAMFVLMWIIAQFILRVFITPFQKANMMLVFITTMALAIILDSLMSISFGVDVSVLRLPIDNEAWQIGSVFITPLQVVIVVSSLFLLLGLAFIIHLTSLGRRIRAVADNAQVAATININQVRVTRAVFGWSVLLAVLAGVLVGAETHLSPYMGFSYTIKGFAAMTLGGLGNVWGVVLGSLILGLVENLSIGLDWWGYSLPASWKGAFAFVIIVLALLFFPRGLLGGKQRKA